MTPDEAGPAVDTMTVTGTGYVVTPPTVGGYQLDRIRFCLTYKPSRWHRFWMRVCLGWTWEDANV